MQILKNYISKYGTKVAFAVLVFISRFGILPPNFSPLGSFGFFSKSLPLYFGTIFAFDFFFGGLYKGMIFTYLGFLGYYVFGILAKNKVGRQLLLLPIASFFFFLASNLGSFFAMYPHTLSGLVSCYTAALPFYQNTLFGDLAFGYTFILALYALRYFVPNFSSATIREV